MISGTVTPALEAVIPLAVIGSDEESQEVEAVIDTGFTGFLTLPNREIAALGLPLVGNQSVTLADGSQVLLGMHLVRILWHEGREHEVLVLQAEGGPLVGMELPYGNRVVMNVVDEGEVIIDAMP